MMFYTLLPLKNSYFVVKKIWVVWRSLGRMSRKNKKRNI